MSDRCILALLTAVLLVAAGCDRRKVTSNDSAATVTSSPKVEWVDPNTIQPGPIRRESLSSEQMERIRKLQSIFVEVDGQSVEQWVDSFKRDMNPDRELGVWERMAKAYTSYCSKHELSLDAKKDVFRTVLLCSATPEEE